AIARRPDPARARRGTAADRGRRTRASRRQWQRPQLRARPAAALRSSGRALFAARSHQTQLRARRLAAATDSRGYATALRAHAAEAAECFRQRFLLAFRG